MAEDFDAMEVCCEAVVTSVRILLCIISIEIDVLFTIIIRGKAVP